MPGHAARTIILWNTPLKVQTAEHINRVITQKTYKVSLAQDGGFH